MHWDTQVKLHGIPKSIVTDHDPTFTNNFYQELFWLQGTQLNLSIAYHPQTNGCYMEALNKCLEAYLYYSYLE
jgi:hypothetical protein